MLGALVLNVLCSGVETSPALSAWPEFGNAFLLLHPSPQSGAEYISLGGKPLWRFRDDLFWLGLPPLALFAPSGVKIG